MSQVTFGSLSSGEIFTYKGTEYKKVDKKKISCCKFVNAVGTKKPTDKLGLIDSTQVEVVETVEVKATSVDEQPVSTEEAPVVVEAKKTETKKGDKDKA